MTTDKSAWGTVLRASQAIGIRHAQWYLIMEVGGATGKEAPTLARHATP